MLDGREKGGSGGKRGEVEEENRCWNKTRQRKRGGILDRGRSSWAAGDGSEWGSEVRTFSGSENAKVRLNHWKPYNYRFTKRKEWVKPCFTELLDGNLEPDSNQSKQVDQYLVLYRLWHTLVQAVSQKWCCYDHKTSEVTHYTKI